MSGSGRTILSTSVITVFSLQISPTVIMKFLIAKKLDMTQEFTPDGTAVAVTVLEALPNIVTQVKTVAKDGYAAVQVGAGSRKEKRVSKPVVGHLHDLPLLRTLREFRIAPDATNNIPERGATITVETFSPGDVVDVVGTSHGRGFAGVVKRHGFHGSPATHGHKDQLRMPGSIGAQQPQRVRKGKRMAGRMGNQRVTTKNLTIVTVDPATNRLSVKGAVPGSRGATVLLQAARTPKHS